MNSQKANYEKEAFELMEKTGGKIVLVAVFGGQDGSGCAMVSKNFRNIDKVPALLLEIASDIEKDIPKMKQAEDSGEPYYSNDGTTIMKMKMHPVKNPDHKAPVNLCAKVIYPSGAMFRIEPKDGKTFQLPELQDIVNGPIEIQKLSGKTGAVMVCNEEGKLSGKKRNPIATQMWQECAEPGSLRTQDDVVGTVLLCHESQIQ